MGSAIHAAEDNVALIIVLEERDTTTSFALSEAAGQRQRVCVVSASFCFVFCKNWNDLFLRFARVPTHAYLTSVKCAEHEGNVSLLPR
jgi:hypothetical protein